VSKRGLPETLRMRHDEHYVEALAASAGAPVGRMISIELLDPNPNQPRQVMGDLSELMASVSEKGVIEPLIVRQRGGRYQIIAGERRYHAAVQVGLREVPVVVREVDDAEVLELALVENLRASYAVHIEQLPWMTPETKKVALEKLAAFHPKIGYPDRWRDYSALSIVRGDAFGNEVRARVFEWQRRVRRLNQPTDRGEWGMTPQTINAYYNPTFNEVVFPAAILQPPFFDPNADPAVNYGGIGAVIGHEMGHGFDDQGRKFGPDGAMQDWWTPKDEKVFKERTTRLIEEFSAFEALPGLKVNGANTIGENIGDLGGLNMAHEAYRISLRGQPAPVLGGLSGDQRFFLAYAQVWRSKYRDGALRELVMLHEVAHHLCQAEPAHGPEFVATIAEEGRNGIHLVTVGYGMGNYNDHLMEQLADQGDGFYRYVDTYEEAQHLYVEELTSLLAPVADDSVTPNVSFGSTVVSPSTATFSVCAVCEGANVSVPEAAA